VQLLQFTQTGNLTHRAAITLPLLHFPIFYLQYQAGYQAQKSLVMKNVSASDLQCSPISAPHCKSVFKH